MRCGWLCIVDWDFYRIFNKILLCCTFVSLSPSCLISCDCHLFFSFTTGYANAPSSGCCHLPFLAMAVNFEKTYVCLHHKLKQNPHLSLRLRSRHHRDKEGNPLSRGNLLPLLSVIFTFQRVKTQTNDAAFNQRKAIYCIACLSLLPVTPPINILIGRWATGISTASSAPVP